MEQETLRKLQVVETEIMDVVHQFCINNNINYSLFAGTALGAVRHKGFIPWDDDIDIFMERSEYERFLDLWNENPVDGYFLQDTRTSATSLNHSKVRKDNTILATNLEMETPIHHGIWIDIFPVDKVPAKKLRQKLMICIAIIGMIYTRGYPVTNRGKIYEVITSLMLVIPKRLQRKIKISCDKSIMKYKDQEGGFVLRGLYSPDALKLVFPENILKTTESILFENREFKICSDYDRMLTIHYGDYMQLPPEEERICKHNPEVIKLG